MNKWEVKYDQVVNDDQRFFFRVSRRKFDDNPLIVFPDDIAIANGGRFAPQHSVGAAFDYTWTVSPTLLLNFRAGVSRMHLPWRPFSFGFDPVANLGMPSYIRDLGDGIEFPGFSPTEISQARGWRPELPPQFVRDASVRGACHEDSEQALRQVRRRVAVPTGS